MTDTTWQPGDPLHPRGSYTNYTFNFRDDPDGDECSCGDAASWPEPKHAGHRLAPGDELAAFIEDHHRWRASQEDVA